MEKINYLTNRELLTEIHNSKNTYCEYTSPEYSVYDLIVHSDEDGRRHLTTTDLMGLCKTPEYILAAKHGKAERISAMIKKETGKRRRISVDEIETTGLIFRILTHEHIPPASNKRKKSKTSDGDHHDVNFYPFKHFVLGEDMELTEVGRSHWKNGKFSPDHGRITENLATMFILLTDRFSQKSNWRGYTYIDEMTGQALLQLSQMALRFNEHKSDNPFSYYTAFMSNAFTRVLNTEKKMQNIRDDILEQHGLTPSFSRQMEYEELVNDGYNQEI